MNWCWHKWTKWGSNQVETRYATDEPKENQLPNAKYLIQHKTCLKCDMEKYRRERIM